MADVQRQVTELTQSLAAQNFEKQETTGHDSDSTLLLIIHITTV